MLLRSLVALLLAIDLANAFGPPPPDGRSAAWAALGMWLFVAWAAWADRAPR